MSNPSLNDFRNMAATARELDEHAPKAEIAIAIAMFACFKFIYLFTTNALVVMKNEHNIFLKVFYTFHYYTTVPLLDLVFNSYFAVFNILVRFSFIGPILSYVITTIFFLAIIVYLFVSIFLVFRVLFQGFPALVGGFLLLYIPSLIYFMYVAVLR
ncbi:hypothetical protein [Acinetobacter sp. P1(2025)]|uniref:hypothetical protein n=1 Tax=Acinetobacter sp. P1(2025) TaxID=3446120 RepID=UPI003F53ABFF